MAKIELEGDKTDETELPQKVVKAKPGKPSAAPMPRKKRVAPIAPLRPMAKKPVAPAEQPEEMLTAEEWDDRLKAEEAAKQQEAYLEKEAEEQKEDEENKLMTKEEFLAYMQKESTKENDAASTAQIAHKPAHAKRGSFLMDRLSANINEALGVIPNPPKSNSAAVAMPKPIIKETVSPAAAPQQDSDDSQEIDSSLQEITGRASSNWMGLKSNPVLAGVVVLGGLILTLVGTFISRDVLAAVVLEIIGLLVFIFGMVFVFGHIRKMVH